MESTPEVRALINCCVKTLEDGLRKQPFALFLLVTLDELRKQHLYTSLSRIYNTGV